MLNRKRSGLTRVYTDKAWKVKEGIYKMILVILAPIWLPFYAITIVSNHIEELLGFGDSSIRLFLDKVVPTFNEKNKKRGKRRG